MQYALLAYRAPDAPREADAPIDDAIAEVLARPYVAGWARLHADETATTLRTNGATTLITDGPFVDSKEYLAGIIVIEADDLDGALAIAQELQGTRSCGAMEVRPIIESLLGGA